MKRWAFLLIFLLALMPVHADTYSTIDWHRLPAYNVFDPFYRQNELITRCSYEELTDMMGTADFRRWNDMEDVCQSMDLMFGHTPPYCARTPVLEFPRAPTARAYVMFQVIPRPVAPDPRSVLIVDPVYPPWTPT